MSLVDVSPPAYSPFPHPSTRSRHSQFRGPQKPRQKKYAPDPIDKLDTTSFGGFYHHGGPFDAARPSFNINPKFSPLAATKEGNRAAWEATPRERQLDMLVKGRPLDGVAFVPPGERAMNGEVMRYEEAEDMMRELNPDGGAYKRWPGIVCFVLPSIKEDIPELIKPSQTYHPDDLKGKGEPGYTIDKERKAREAAAAASGIGRSQSARESESRGEYEMMPQPSRRHHHHHHHRSSRDGGKRSGVTQPLMVRQRSASASEVVASGSRPTAVQLKEGLKRRLVSLKRM